MTTLSVINVANEFIRLAREQNNKTLDSLKLQKLCFIAYGRYLAAENDKLFYEEIQAWKYGPASSKLYNTIKCCKIEGEQFLIKLNKRLINFSDTDFDIFSYNFKIQPDISKSQMNIIEKTWNDFLNESGMDLVLLTHKEGTPWKQVYNGNLNEIIPDDIIRNYYINEGNH